MADPNSDPASPGVDDPSKTGTPNGAVSAEDVQKLKDAHQVELRERDGKIASLSEEVTSERAAKEAATGKLQESEANITKANESISQAQERIDKLESSAIEARKSALVKNRGLKAEQLTDMDESQLTALEAVLPEVNGANIDPNNLGLGGSGDPGASADLSARDAIKAGLTS